LFSSKYEENDLAYHGAASSIATTKSLTPLFTQNVRIGSHLQGKTLGYHAQAQIVFLPSKLFVGVVRPVNLAQTHRKICSAQNKGKTT
jgi:hypothetical protein